MATFSGRLYPSNRGSAPATAAASATDRQHSLVIGADRRLDLRLGGGAQHILFCQTGDGTLVMLGRPTWRDGRPVESETAKSLILALRDDPRAALAGLDRQFAIAWVSADGRRCLLACDRFASYPLFHARRGSEIFFAADYRSLLAAVGETLAIDDQAVYDYLFFTTIPSHRCLHRDVGRVPPSTYADISQAGTRLSSYWTPEFQRTGSGHADQAKRLRELLQSEIAALAGRPATGCFLSGGLDSSTVCGLAAASVSQAVPAFTMGFDEAEYDETRFARVTASRFGLDLREHRICADEVLECLDTVTSFMPEPFGNPSLLSTYICARVAAHDGITTLLAGDGGDELFAGNERYQKQLAFQHYYRVPRVLRQWLIDPLGRHLQRAELTGLAGKAASYLFYAATPLPRRMYRYNLLERHAPESALTDGFLSRIDTGEPLNYLSRLYDGPEHGDFLDRLLFLDWTVTLADNDLRKVREATRLAGLEVEFPMLSNEVVALSTQIPSEQKLNRRELRAFYKKAFADFLPPEIINKPKHGFGVPVGPWLRRHEGLRELVYSRLERLKARRILQAGFLDRIIESQRTGHAVYYGALLWPMFMLESWLAEHADFYGFDD